MQPPTTTSSPATGSLLMVTAVTAWGGMFVIGKNALKHIDAFHLTAIRYGVASIVLLGILAAVEGREALRFDGRFLRILLLGSVGFAGFNLLVYEGLDHTRPQNASLIVAIMPLITMLVVAARTRTRPARGNVLAVALALAGVALVISKGDPSTLVSGGLGGGDLLVLGGVIGWVIYTLGAQQFPAWSPLRYTALSAAAGTLTILAATEIGTLTGGLSTPSGADLRVTWIALVYVVVLAAIVAVLAFNSGVRRLGPSNAVLFMNLVPVTTFTIEIARGYRPGTVELAGAGLTIAALVANNLVQRRRTAVVRPPVPAARPLVARA